MLIRCSRARCRKAGEMAGFVKKGLVGLRFAMAAPIITGDEEEGTEVGIKPVGKGNRGGRGVVKALVERGGGLVMCDVTMFEVSAEELESILDACVGAKAVAFPVEVEGWEDLFQRLGAKERGIEMLEIVGVPGESWVERIKAGGETGLGAEVLEKLGGKWKDLKSVKVSLLRTKGEEWAKEGEVWTEK